MLDIPEPNTILVRPRRLHRSQLLIALFGLPELSDIILSHLGRSDLVQWARVSKAWHHAAIPYIWHDFSRLSKSQYKRLTRMVIDDYQRVCSHPPKSMGDNQSALAKYCPLIRKLGFASGKYSIFSSFLFDFIIDDTVQNEGSLPDIQLSTTTAQGIFQHFMIHCTQLHALDFTVRHHRFYESVKVIADSAIQHLRHLSIHGTILQCAFKYMMARFPATLETLELSCWLHSDSEQSEMKMDETGQESLLSLRRLTLRYRAADYFQDTFFSSLWIRCQFVEALYFIDCGIGLFQPRASTMATFMETTFPGLNTISIEEGESRCNLKDEGLARLLSSSRLGWRSVSVLQFVELGEQSWDALSQYSATLEKFEMAKWHHQKHTELRPFFTSFPRLQSFVTLAEKEGKYSKINPIGANDWIHQDPLSGVPTPWPCEYTLTDLRISICGIPRPDITHDRRGRKRHPMVEESYLAKGG